MKKLRASIIILLSLALLATPIIIMTTTSLKGVTPPRWAGTSNSWFII